MTKSKKKDKGPKMSLGTTKSGEQFKLFEDLTDFETYLKNETEDNEFDNLFCKLKYYPPFVLKDAKSDPEKIQEKVNCHSKKFVRHLNQHVEKHLLKDINEALLQDVDLKFKNKSKDKQVNKMTWFYNDEREINNKKFKVDLQISCNNEGAMVEVEYRTTPVNNIVVDDAVINIDSSNKGII